MPVTRRPVKTTQNGGLGAKSSPQGRIFRILSLRFNRRHRLTFFPEFHADLSRCNEMWVYCTSYKNMHHFYAILRPFGWHWCCVEQFGCHWRLYPADHFVSSSHNSSFTPTCDRIKQFHSSRTCPVTSAKAEDGLLLKNDFWIFFTVQWLYTLPVR